MTPDERTRQRPLGSLIASAQRLTNKRLTKRSIDSASGRRVNPQIGSEGWQEDAWDMYDLVGEQRFLATTLAGRMGKARLYVGKVSKNLTDDPLPVEDKRINDVLDSVGRSQAGRAQLVERLAVNLFIAGDGWLVGIPDHLYYPEVEMPEDYDPDNVPLSMFNWRMLSTTEVSSDKDGHVRLQLDLDQTLETNPDDVYLIRVWRPHPRRWWEADSSTRASLPTLKELVGLTLHISAQVDSRLAGAGLLLIPASVQSAIRKAAGLDPDAEDDMFTDALIQAMTTPIQDRGVASAVVPLVVTVPDDAIGAVKHLTFSTPLDGEARNLRDEAIRRLALGQDAPPEVLLGTASSNHWGAWLVQEEVVYTHLSPPLALICDALTTQYLWPVLESMGVADFEEYVVWFDVSHLIARPNRFAEAVALYDKGLIDDDAMRREGGFGAEDVPSAADPATDIILKMVSDNPGMLRSPELEKMINVLKAIIGGTSVSDAVAERVDQPQPPPAAGQPEQPSAAPVAVPPNGADTPGGKATPGGARVPEGPPQTGPGAPA